MTKYSGAFTLQAQMQNAAATTWSRAPGAPTIGTATSASGTSASITFTAPTDLGFGTISYTATSSPGGLTGTSATSPVTVSGLTTGTSYTFTVAGTTPGGTGPASAASNSVTPIAQGQQAFTTAGTFSWVAPAGVTSVSVVVVGGGGGGFGGFGSGGGGGGGALAYKNNFSVTPGTSYTVVVGAGGTATKFNTPSTAGGASYFSATCVVRATGGGRGYDNCASGGTRTAGCGGGSGGGTFSASAGGGGAGGYSGNGGRGGNAAIYVTAGAGGGGGGGGGFTTYTSGPYFNYSGTGGGGGVGLLGEGSSGCAGSTPRGGGGAGSGGFSGSSGGNNTGGAGGAYGGGGAGGGFKYTCAECGSTYIACCGGAGAVGAVRIIWPGNTRSFPSTNTGNV